MPQIILSENNFVDNFTLQTSIPVRIYHKAEEYKIGRIIFNKATGNIFCVF